MIFWIKVNHIVDDLVCKKRKCKIKTDGKPPASPYSAWAVYDVVRGGRKTPDILYSFVFFFDAVVFLVVLDGAKSSSSEDSSVRSETSDSDMMEKFEWEVSG